VGRGRGVILALDAHWKPSTHTGRQVKAENSGFYGEEPRLTDLDHGDLKYNSDFRIYHALLVRTLGADPAPSVGTGRVSLGFL
jgi:hypothetical protein